MFNGIDIYSGHSQLKQVLSLNKVIIDHMIDFRNVQTVL